MKVWQLRAILEHVPGDLEVHIVGGHGTCTHVESVYRHVTRPSRAPLLPGWRWSEGDPVPPDLLLGWTGWWLPEPDFRLHGPFRQPAVLERRLDPELPT